MAVAMGKNIKDDISSMGDDGKERMEAEAEPSSRPLREQQHEETLIAFFDVETTVPLGSGRGSGGSGYSLLEFGAILVCPRRLFELKSFSTLIRPSDLNAITSLSIRCNGITRDSVTNAPSFVDVADQVFSILHGRIWAGHNILRFDCVRIKEAFAEIGRSPPEPKGTIDTLPLLTQRFGRRAGNMKMATLASYFGLGEQKHRSLEDVRLNLEVLKHCAAVLFMESSVLNSSPVKSLVSGISVAEDIVNDPQASSSLANYVEELSHDMDQSDHPLSTNDTTCLTAQVEQMKIDSSQLTVSSVKRQSASDLADATIKKSGSCDGFLEPDDVLVHCITVAQSRHSPNAVKMHLLHLNVPLWLCCRDLTIRFGISSKFMDHAGRPKLSILVSAPEHLCRVLCACESLVQSAFRSNKSNSDWRSLIRRDAFTNSSTIRLHIPTTTNNGASNDPAIYSTNFFRKDPSGTMNKLAFSKLDPAELELLLAPGTLVDGFFCFDTFDYQHNAGIRLVAKCLAVHSK